MKMFPAGSADILNYAPYSRNCNLGQCRRPYFAPVPTLADVQVFLNLGTIQPAAIDFTAINLCAPFDNDAIISDCFIIAFNGSYWYAVYKNFDGPNYTRFMIAASVSYVDETTKTYFSEQYQSAGACDSFTKVSVCYPYNYNAEDPNSIYVGQPDATRSISGKSSVFYHHQYWVRETETVETSNKITFTANLYKSFNTDLKKLFEFRPVEKDLPGWYKDYLLAVYFRGQIYIDDVPELLSDINFECYDEAADLWKAYAVLSKEVKGAFGCADIACIDDCHCFPVIIPSITFASAQSGVFYSKVIPISGSLNFIVSDITKPAWLTTFAIVGSNLVMGGTPADGDIGGPNRIAFTVTNDCSNAAYDSEDGGITVDEHPSEETPTAILTFGFINVGGSFLQFTATLNTPIDANINITRFYADGFPATPCTGGSAVASAQMNKSIDIAAGSLGTGTTPSVVSGSWASASHYNIYNVIVNSFPHLDGNMVMIGSYLVTLVIPDCV